MSVRRIIQTFNDWQQTGEPLVLATVYDTAGSTYSKAGQRILIRGNANYQGLVSGGCLEGDLAQRARAVLETGEPAAVTYDMRDDGEDLFGLGVGCNGMIRVFLQTLDQETEYEPFASIAQLLLTDSVSSVATVIASADPELPPGATLVWTQNSAARQPPAAPALARLVAGCEAVQASGSARFDAAEDDLAVLYAPLNPVPRLLVLGAGLDAVPVIVMAAELGWRVSIADHRPAYLENHDFVTAERAVLVEPAALDRELSIGDFDAVIVMSHHLATDQAYLKQLAPLDIPYIGVLGPRARRDRLLAALGEAGKALGARLKGPVGLDIGADSPESIALSLLAEIHLVLKGPRGAGRSLS
jgi:xanthine/CO dehydrogenase XdhC/CoxF family maturation factor